MTFVTGVVLAAGSSSRLGRPKQLLRLGAGTLLGATLASAARCGFDQLLVTLGADADIVRRDVALAGAQVVDAVHAAYGCSASIGAALDVVDETADGIVVLLGDQPGIDPHIVRGLVARGHRHPVAVARYRDGLGHPFWFARPTFADLRDLRGDKAIWKLMASGAHPVLEVPVPGTIPLDVDTWDDYERLRAGAS